MAGLEMEAMAVNIENLKEIVSLIPAVKRSPGGVMWLSYDQEADVLYVSFKKPSCATDSEMTDDDVIVRMEGEDIVGFTILHASLR